jgi:triosephosphate isomerase
VRRAAERSGRDPVIAVSLKMYFGIQETLDWCARVHEIAISTSAVSSGAVRLILIPSSPLLLPIIEMFRDTPVSVGAQNLYFVDRGPFTGEVSGAMLAELGCRYVEVGHIERRRLFGESDDTVARKVEAANRNGLCPIVCVGEEDRVDSAAAARESTRQLESAMSRVAPDAPAIVAYEPRWAIGALKPAPDSHIAEVCSALQESLLKQRPGTDRVIYGGSAGPGLLERLGDSVDGLFLGRFVHDPAALRPILVEAGKWATSSML